MTRHVPIQERSLTFKVTASIPGGRTMTFSVIAHDAREALKKATTPENHQEAWLKLGRGELLWEVQEDFF